MVGIGAGDRPDELIASGVRIFPAGKEGVGTGKEESLNVKRRTARLRRRLLDRRTRRRRNLFKILTAAGLLPNSIPTNLKEGSPSHRDSTLAPLYARLVESEVVRSGLSRCEASMRLPYLLRDRALSGPLTSDELGYALYQLSSRRGFLSNRKSTRKEDEEDGIVKESIKTLESDIRDAGKATLGSYLAVIGGRDTRVRTRYTSRRMIESEFDAIVAAQRPHHPVLTGALASKIRHAIFYQRPLKSVAHLVGRCELEPKRRRAPMYLPSTQRIRTLADVNNLRISDSRTPWAPKAPLTQDQRDTVLAHLDQGDVKLSHLKKVLGLHQKQTFPDGKSTIIGFRSSRMMREALGASRWDSMTLVEQDALCMDLYSVKKPEAFQKRAVKLGVPADVAKELHSADCFEDDYHGFSTKAIYALLPHVEAGLDTTTAQMRAYPDHFKASVGLDDLPPVAKVMNITNPVVTRTLTEVRRVVNELIRTYGKPWKVRIELARDLKQSADKRDKDAQSNRRRERERKKIRERITNEVGIVDPRRSDVEKALLWEECNGTCPYTGKDIPFASLFWRDAPFNVEHIIPFSRCLDDSYLNKTLCCAVENQRIKKNMTPRECYGDYHLDQIIRRVEGFRTSSGKPSSDKEPDYVVEQKLKRFLATTQDVANVMSEFTSSQLNDTRYVSKEAVRYISLLYGGIVDASGVLRVQASSGKVTEYLRDVWDLNRVLTGGTVKQRFDHRHHAVDAVAVALTDPEVVHMLNSFASGGRGRLFRTPPPPWEGFMGQVEGVIKKVVASHRAPRRLGGALHEETHYSRPKNAHGKSGAAEHTYVRKPLGSIKRVGDIVEPAVRGAVAALVGIDGDPSQVFKKDVALPRIVTRTGAEVVIRRARVKTKVSPTVVGTRPDNQRYVKLGNNSHAEVVEVTKPGKARKLADEMVSVLEGYGRREAGKPVFSRVDSDGRPVLLTLRKGDVVEVTSQKTGSRDLVIIRSISKGDYEAVGVNDARPKGDIDEARDTTKLKMGSFVSLGLEKVHVDVLGSVK